MTELYVDLIIQNLTTGLMAGMIGVFIAITILVVLQKKGYLEREHVLLKILTKFYYVLLPLTFFFSFLLFGSVFETRNMVVNEVGKVLTDLEAIYSERLVKDLHDNYDQYWASLDTLPSSEAIATAFLEKEQQQEATIYDALLKEAIIYTLDNIEDLGKKISEGALLTTMKGVFGVVEQQINKKIDQIFTFLFLPSIALFFAGIALPFVEIMLYNKMKIGVTKPIKKLLEDL